jgi:hypothetical protein
MDRCGCHDGPGRRAPHLGVKDLILNVL